MKRLLLYITILVFLSCSGDENTNAQQLDLTIQNLNGSWEIFEVANDNGTGPGEYRPARPTEKSIFTFFTDSTFILEVENIDCPGTFNANALESKIIIELNCEEFGESTSNYRVISLTNSSLELSGSNIDEAERFRLRKL